MTPQQQLVAGLGLGLVVFRIFTSQQRHAIGVLFSGVPDGSGSVHLTGPPNGEGPGKLLPPGTLGNPPPQVAPPTNANPLTGLVEGIAGPGTYGQGPGHLLPPGTLTPTGPQTNHNPLTR